MIRAEYIIKVLMKELKSLYPEYNIYLGNLEENANYPCFLIYLGIENAKVFDTELNKKTLFVDIVYFNSKKVKGSKNFISNVKVKDNLEECLLNKDFITVEKDKISFDYSISNPDELLNITLKVLYFNSIVKESIDYEVIEEIIYNNIND